MSDAIASLKYFSGLNTVEELTRKDFSIAKLGSGYKATYPLTVAVNVDISNDYALSSRGGNTKIISGSMIHSAWGDGDTAFFIDGTVLYLFDGLNTTQLLTGLTNMARMSYYPVNDRIYMTNGTYIGYYKDLAMHSLAEPNMNYKSVLPAGRFIAHYNATLFVAKGKVLYRSDALCDHYDTRSGFNVFANDITMVRPVSDGLYVSDGKTWFISDKMENPDAFNKAMVLDADAIPYTDIDCDGKYVGDGIDEKVAIWTSTIGVCIGNSKGVVGVPTLGKYIMAQHGIGTAVIRNKDGQVHYLATLG